MTTEQFIRGKTKIMTEFSRERETLESAVAGRGFSFTPGFMYRIVNNLETDTKQKLSDLNFQLLEQAVERELRESKIDYDIAYKNAAVAWEIEKQELISDWSEELAQLKKEDSQQEDSVKKYAIEVGRRAIELIAAKSAIALQIEEYQKQMAELDGQTATYEGQLADAKILTANKKLEMLPYISQLISIEWDLLDKDKILANKELVISEMLIQLASKDVLIAGKTQELVNKKGDIVTAEESLVSAKNRLLTALGTKADAEEDLIDAEEAAQTVWTNQVYPATLTLLDTMEEYITELATQLALINQIADVKADTADIKELGLDKQRAVLSAEHVLTSAMESLTSALAALAAHKETVLTPAITDLVTTLNVYVSGGTLAEQAGLKRQIASTRAAIAALVPEKVRKEAEIATAEEAKNSQRVLLETAKFAVDNLISQNRVKSAEQALDNIVELATLLNEHRSSILETREAAFAGVLSFRADEAAERLNISTGNRLAIENKQQDHLEDTAEAYADFKKDDANIRTAASTITAQLNHILSQD
ncbi:MAG: hypothetical protein SVO01_00145 [Thermotogota bacterium]|nr:hypothetical protein [Thermotogota bacterium]